MKKYTTKSTLHVFEDSSVLFDEFGNATEFKEGVASKDATLRLKKLKESLTNGFLQERIDLVKEDSERATSLTEEHAQILSRLVASVTSEVGRGLVGLALLQLTIKSIIPEQSIRLHKASKSRAFSWVEGISMRVIDKNFITPVLRYNGLLKLNRDGFMMTRTLAENYPYSKLYKAAIRGAKEEWTELVDLVESNSINSSDALNFMIGCLINRSDSFNSAVEQLQEQLASSIEKGLTFKDVMSLLSSFMDESVYSARIFEVIIHAFMQVIDSRNVLEGYLKPLSQMRSANKKHGNIGDVELTASEGGIDIIESWDAKYGKTYLRDEIEELNEKIFHHPSCEIVGFITDKTPNRKPEIVARCTEISEIHGAKVQILSFDEWVELQIVKYDFNEEDLAIDWMIAFVESISQKRREFAPIDEPTIEWVIGMKNKLEEY